MATITIIHNAAAIKATLLVGIGEITGVSFSIQNGFGLTKLTIHRMSETRFENVVKRVLTKNLTEQGITPLSIEYSE